MLRFVFWTYHSAIAGIFIGILAACGDLQDPSRSASTSVTQLAGQSASDPTSTTDPQGPAVATTEERNRQSNTQSTAASDARSVRLGWDPSASQDVLGYRVYLITVSTSMQEIIDVGSKTELALPLKIGESYGFTVTAYNASFESEALPYLRFQVF